MGFRNRPIGFGNAAGARIIGPKPESGAFGSGVCQDHCEAHSHASSTMDLGYLVECGIFGEHILVYFAWNELFAIEAVSRALYDAVNCESVWRRAARALFRDKMFVPARCLRLIAPGNDRNERADLRALPVKDLKARCAAYALDASACVEKADLIRLLAARESRAAQPREPLARLAVRAAVLDRRRNAITRDELCAIPWAIRLRADGGLHMLAHADPWWQGAAETGKARNLVVSRRDANRIA